MPYLWLEVDNRTLRKDLERNAIALLSNWGRKTLDQSSDSWVGSYCNAELVRDSGLWNNNHVRDSYQPEFLDCLESAVNEMRR